MGRNHKLAATVALGAALATLTLGVVGYMAARAEQQTEKEQIEQRYQQLRLVSPAPARDPVAEAPTVRVTNPPAPTGILATAVAPFPAAEFRATNRWQGYVGDELVAVIAGAPANTNLGELRVLTMSRDGSRILGAFTVELPGRPGRARVSAADGTKLVVATESGMSFDFDAATRVLTAR